MLGLGKNLDIDKLIVSYVDPPQILTMSEVNKYFNALVADKRDIFIDVKYNIEFSLIAQNEWIIQWHVRSMSDTIRQIRLRQNNQRMLQLEYFDTWIDPCFQHKNLSFAQFLLKISVNANISKNFILDKVGKCFIRLCAENFDMAFVKQFDDYLEHYYQTNLFACGPIIILQNIYVKIDILLGLLTQKQYDGVLYFLRLLKNTSYEIDCVDLDRYIENKDCPLILRECSADFLNHFFDLIGQTKRGVDRWYLTQACLATTDTLFFELISTNKYDDCINHAKILCLAAQSGHISIFEWIRERTHIPSIMSGVNGIHINNNLLDAFELACYFGHMDMVKWLLEINPNILIHKKNEMAFFAACINGHISIAKYLIELGESASHGRIDIHAKCDLIKRTNIIADIIGKHYELAEWLFVLGIESYGKFDLGHELAYMNSRSNSDQIAYDRMYELSMKYYGETGIDRWKLYYDIVGCGDGRFVLRHRHRLR